MFSRFPIVCRCACAAAVIQTLCAAVPERPHLFFSAPERDVVRMRVRAAPFAERWAQFEARAVALLGQAPSDMPRYNLGHMGTLAFVYAMTGDERFARRAVVEARAVVARDVWISPQHTDFTRGADLWTAELSLGLALVYDWCHAALTEAERAILRHALLEKCLARYAVSVDERTRDWWFEHEVNNWRGVIHGGMGVAALALLHESAEARRLAEINRREVPRVFREVVREDGGGDEGVGYHHYGIAYAAYALMAQRRFFGDETIDATLALMRDRRAGYWDIYMQGPDLHYANIGRMGGDWGRGLWGRDRTSGGPNAELCALFESAAPGGDPLLLWGADNGSSRFYWPGAAPFWFLWRRPEVPSLTGAPRPELQPAKLFPATGHAILQTGDLWLAFSGGRNHNRLDLGAFVLVVGTERLVHIPADLQHTQTADQSTGLVNGRGQIRDRRAHYRHFGSGEGFHHLALDLGAVYEDRTLRRFVRHLTMVGDRYVAIVDDFAASEPAVFEVRVQTEQRALAVEGATARIGGAVRELYVLTAANCAAELSTGRGVLSHVRLVTTEPVRAARLITVLWPGERGALPPRHVAWRESGELVVGEEVLRFDIAADGSVALRSVNGQRWTDALVGESLSLLD